MEKIEICLASNNAHKIVELQQMLGETFLIKTMKDIGCEDEIEEKFTYAIDYGGEQYEGANISLKTKAEVIHAESNAIGKLARSSESGEGATMYITHAPCFDCAKLIHVAGINKVFYRNQYRNTDGIDFLNKCNIEVELI